ncbi:5'/3'-nucleotidase SurE [Casimicrobium huifangae]|uniref:5'/3'-nucleotidase SurE n=1 Tax=Casimicrobium huifangae TaxID=2591109 RepID=UPI0012EBB66C|nr:5'/3'-nucleotidase SurE [Casimicrobium huifangae]
MKILVSNDDGYQAPGILALVKALSTIAEVAVVAPADDRSAASSSLTVGKPVRIHEAGERRYYVEGTPADCVHIAVNGLLDFRPDLVVTGVNNGSNLGDDTIYSGTVAAAMEGYLLGIPGIAMSLTHKPGKHFDTAAHVAAGLVRRVMTKPLPMPWLLNVNVPDVPEDDLAGMRVVRLGRRHQAEPVERTHHHHEPGVQVWRIGPAGKAADAGPDTDFGTIAENCVSVTPLLIDLTRYDNLRHVANWLA